MLTNTALQVRQAIHQMILSSLVLCLPIAISAFSTPRTFQGRRSHILSTETQLFAEAGAPQYEKVDAVLSRIDFVGEGSALLHIETEEIIDYKAGHVLALEIESDGKSLSEKNSEDTAQNGGWMRGPYTVSRATDKSFDVLVKVVGDKSRAFASAQPGTPVKFGGKFKVPILDGVQKENTKRLVLISTGVGVGPCMGAIEEAMKEEAFPPIELYANFRTEQEIVCAEYLDSLDIKWRAIVTSEMGRISANEKNMEIIMPSEEGFTLEDTHYHLIGNGQFVNEWKDGVIQAGVPESKVTFEMYFNHRAEVDPNAVEVIAKSIAASSGVPAVN